jgi:lactoylglutathione lyase
MFSHVFTSVGDFDRALDFYRPLMASLGLEPRFCERDKPWAGWHAAGGARPLFVICRPYDGAYFRDPDGNKLCVACHDAVHGDVDH